MVVGLRTTYANSANHHGRCELKVVQSRFSPVSSTNKTDHHDITEILLKVALNTITPNPYYTSSVVEPIKQAYIYKFKAYIIQTIGHF